MGREEFENQYQNLKTLSSTNFTSRNFKDAGRDGYQDNMPTWFKIAKRKN
jgi:hypothetical protein